MTNLAFIFPGQNSRYPAMLSKLAKWDHANAQWIENASDILRRDLRTHFRPDNPDIFRHNRDVQIGVFLANHLHWQNLEREGIRADYSAGLSLGEYNHLVHVGALDFNDALRLLEIRGELYEQGPRGKMTAVFPVSAEELKDLLSQRGLAGQVAVGMINSPRQCVLSGDAAAVDEATEAAAEEFMAETVVVDERLPMHSPLFRCVGEQLRCALAGVHWRVPDKPYISNLSGTFATQPDLHDFVESLDRHTWNTVRWRDCIETLLAESEELTFVETGPKCVLTNFFSRKWVAPRRFHTDAAQDFESELQNLIEELSNGYRAVATGR
jgi:[acyl-carrier-protein] S-malonyltransferase